MPNNLFYLLFFFLFIFSCKNSESNISNQEDLVVVYKEHHLMQTEINATLPENLTENEREVWVNNYIDKWLKDKLLIEEAKKRLNKESKEEIKQKVLDYEEDLLLNEYTNYLIENVEIDSITDAVMESYYRDNINNFKLNKELLQYVYISGNESDARKSIPLMTNNKEQIKKFNDLVSEKKLVNSRTDLNQWVSKDELFMKLSAEMKSKINQNKTHKDQFLRISKNGNVELLKILDYRTEGDDSPFSYVKSSIKNRLINKRKLILLNKLKNQLYNNAEENNDFQIFKP